MSRSTRKKPIVGNTTCRSERNDKKTWHRRWRAHQRSKLAAMPFDDADGKLAVSVKALSNVWDMGKDGRRYRSLSSRKAIARQLAWQRAGGRRERKALEARFLHRFLAK